MGFKVRYYSEAASIGRYFDERGTEPFVRLGGTVYLTMEEAQAVIDSHVSEFEDVLRPAARRVELAEEGISLVVDHLREKYSVVKSYRSAT